MRMVKNIWKPDTCGCVLEFEFDADLPADEVVHTPTSTVKACAFHQAGTPASRHADVLSENTKKNRALEEVKSKVDPSVKDEVAWEIDAERNIAITVPESEKGKNITTAEEGVIVR